MPSKSKNSPITSWIHLILLIAFLAGVWLALSSPPFAKPDEDLHFLKAIAVSRGNFICKIKNGTPVNSIPKNYFEYVKSNNLRRDRLAQEPTYIDNEHVNEISSCVLPFMFYVIPGALISVLHAISVPIHIIFFSGRIANFIFACLIFYFSLQKLPNKLKLISIFVFMFPMTLFQLSSYSKDVYHLAFGLFLFNESLKFVLFQRENKVRIIIFTVVLFLFILSRPQYFPFILLTLLIPFKKKQVLATHLKKTLLLLLLLVQSLLLVLWYSFSNQVYLSPHNQIISLTYANQINPQQQLANLLHQPWIIPIAMVETFFDRVGFYLISMIGVFGWVDVLLPDYIYLGYSLLMIAMICYITTLFSDDKKLQKKFTPFVIAVYFGVMFLSSLGIFSAMYLYASPVGSHVVYGVQGRYFLMILPLAFLVTGYLCNKIWHFIKNQRWKIE